LDEFDTLLLQIIEQVFRRYLGDKNAEMVFDYLDKQSCAKIEIPQNLKTFSSELRRLLDSEESQVERSRDSIRSSATILEDIIFRDLCISLARSHVRLAHVHLNEMKRPSFEDLIHKLKEAYLAETGKKEKLQPIQNGRSPSTR
jgi:hypothetical protein